MSISEVEKLLDSKLKGVATKDCINELKELIIAQDEKIRLQEKEISTLKQDSTEKENRIKILESQVSIIQNSVNILKRDKDDSEQ